MTGFGGSDDPRDFVRFNDILAVTRECCSTRMGRNDFVLIAIIEGGAGLSVTELYEDDQLLL